MKRGESIKRICLLVSMTVWSLLVLEVR